MLERFAPCTVRYRHSLNQEGSMAKKATKAKSKTAAKKPAAKKTATKKKAKRK